MKTTALVLAALLATTGIALLAPSASADRCITNNENADLCLADQMSCPGDLWTTWFLGQPTHWQCA